MLSLLNQYAHGFVAVPVVVACRRVGMMTLLKKEKRVSFSTLVKNLSANPGHLRVAPRLLVSMGWVRWHRETDSYELTVKATLWEKIPDDIDNLLSFSFEDYVKGCLDSDDSLYRPMLRRMDDVLFGDCRVVFQKDAQDRERHVDRTLNVIGSGFQHVKYFEAMREAVLRIFNQQPFESQPVYVADTGCGDGSFLKTI